MLIFSPIGSRSPFCLLLNLESRFPLSSLEDQAHSSDLFLLESPSPLVPRDSPLITPPFWLFLEKRFDAGLPP